jgi:hypothetical protein
MTNPAEVEREADRRYGCFWRIVLKDDVTDAEYEEARQNGELNRPGIAGGHLV